MIQTEKNMPGAPAQDVGIPNGAQVEVRIAKDAPLGERIAQARTALQKIILQAKFQGGRVQPDATAFVALFLFMEELLQRVEAIEGKGSEGGIVEP
jgi:hypothetical protein